MGRQNNRGRREAPGSKFIINEKIRAREVRVVEGLPSGIYSTSEALKSAKDLEMDLVVINMKTSPPICKIVDFKKFLYEEKKRVKDQGKNQIKVIVKEVQFSPNIGEHDYDTKKKNVIKFLEKGNKVKATVFFKGRNIVFKDRGELVLAKLASEIEEYGTPEAMPLMMGKKMTFTIKPKKNNK